MTNDTVVVLGGGGLVGTLICSVLKQQGLHTRVLDCRAGEHEDEHHQVDVNNPPSDSAQLFSNAIAVVFALPERVAVDAIGWVLQVVSVDVVFIPTCSVQGHFLQCLESAGRAAAVHWHQSNVFSEAFGPGAYSRDLPGRRGGDSIVH